MINIDELLAKHRGEYDYALKAGRQDKVSIPSKVVKKVLREYTELLLKEVVDKARGEHVICFGQKTGEVEIDEESITSVINDINFD